MGKTTISVILLATGALVCACVSINEADLQGNWKANLVMEGSDTIAADLSATLLTLSPSHDFVYQMTNIESMTGTYQLDRDILELRDQSTSETIRVQIIEHANEALTLRMNHDGQERLVRFVRQ